MQNQWKVETHAHTAEVSLCGKMPAAQMVRAWLKGDESSG